MIHFGGVPAGSTLYVPFATYDGNGASVTLTGLAVTDIEIFKNGSATQRASDNGYALLDTDGIDFDGITGIHGFSIDLSDDSDSGFFSVGAQFWVVVSAVTVDGQTVSFIAATFRIVAAEAVAGKPKVDVDAFGGSAGAFSGGRPSVDVNSLANNSLTAAAAAADLATELAAPVLAVLGTPAASVSEDIAAVKTQTDAIETDTQDIQSRLPDALVSGRIDASVGAMAANTLTASALDAGAVTEIQTGLATSSTLATLSAVADRLELGKIYGAVAAGTLTTIAFTTDLAGYADDALIGRVILFTSGDLIGQGGRITDYASTGGLVTVSSDFTTAPSVADAFVIV